MLPMDRSYRPLRPLPPKEDVDMQMTAPESSSMTKKRRVGTSVACNSCRRKKIRCDSQRPTCSNCRATAFKCEYRDELRLPKNSNGSMVEVVQLLGKYPASDIARVIDSIKNESDPENILAAVRAGLAEYHQLEGDPSSSLAVSSESQPPTPIETLMRDNFALHPRKDGSAFLLETWTSVTDDIVLVRHLLALYFCWEYPSFAPVSKEHFLQDFHDMRPQYCSPMLVNALLALACHLSDRPTATGSPTNVYSTGDAFFEESRRAFALAEDHHSLTTVQTLAILSLREARCSRVTASRQHAEYGMRLALEMGLHKAPAEGCEDEPAVLSKTFWGLFSLHQAWSLMCGILPQTPSSLNLPPKPAVAIDVEVAPWVPYVDGDAQLRPHVQQSNVRTVYQCFCSHSELVHQTIYLFYSPNRHFTAAHVLQKYQQYLNWYDKLPEVMKLGHNSTPAVLFLHLYYHFSVLILFRRFLKLRLRGSQMSPRNVCSQSADAIESLVASYSNLYTLRRTPSFMPYFIFASVTMRIAISAASTHPASYLAGTPTVAESRTVDALARGIKYLTEIAPYHPFAEHALNILCYLHRKCDVEQTRQSPTDNEKTGETGLVAEFMLSARFWLQDDPMLCSAQDLERAGFLSVH